MNQLNTNQLQDTLEILTKTVGTLATSIAELNSKINPQPQPSPASELPQPQIPTLSAEELLYKFRVEEDLRFIPKILPLHKKKEE